MYKETNLLRVRAPSAVELGTSTKQVQREAGAFLQR